MATFRQAVRSAFDSSTRPWSNFQIESKRWNCNSVNGNATIPLQKHSERERTTIGVQVSNLYYHSTVIFAIYGSIFPPIQTLVNLQIRQIT